MEFDEDLFCRIMGVKDEGLRYYNTYLTENNNIFSMKKFKQVSLKVNCLTMLMRG